MEEQNEHQENESTSLTILNDSGKPVKTIVGENATALSNILIDNIKKVQDNPAYIGQAKEIRDNVREIVNLARVEIDMIREVRKVVHHK